MEIADARHRDACEVYYTTGDEYDKNIMDYTEMEYRNAWEAWVSALDSARDANN